MMTRKHYVAFAGAIAALAKWADRHAMHDAIAPILAADNPRFDRARFSEACKVEDPDRDATPPESDILGQMSLALGKMTAERDTWRRMALEYRSAYGAEDDVTP
jgi:hypothetical protein